MSCQCLTPYVSPAVVAAMEEPVVLYTLLAIAIAVYVVRWRTHPVRMYHLLGNPCVLLTYVYRPPAQRDPHRGGPSAPLLSLIGAINFLRNGKQLLIDGYQRVSVLSSTSRLCC